MLESRFLKYDDGTIRLVTSQSDEYVAVSTGQWHTLRLELDWNRNQNRIFLDGKARYSLSNSELISEEIEGPIIGFSASTSYIRAMRYKVIT